MAMLSPLYKDLQEFICRNVETFWKPDLTLIDFHHYLCLYWHYTVGSLRIATFLYSL